jgi:hypothetical protein
MTPPSEQDGAGKPVLLIVFVEALCEEKWGIAETKL